jgi:uncharacterized protein (TIGR03437 family)
MKLLSNVVVCIAVLQTGADAATVVLAHLPNTGVNAAKTDAAGNVYVAGFQGTVGKSGTYDAFVSKLSPDGSKTFYTVRFAGSGYDSAVALDLDSAGAVYVLGATQAADFPVTSGAPQNTIQNGANAGFVAKIDGQGKVVYATFIGGSADIQPAAGGIVVNSAGEAIVSGIAIGDGFPSVPGSPINSAAANTGFLLKLDATGAKLLAAFRGVGGRLVLDGQGNVYVAGAYAPAADNIPLTPQAFQTTFELHPCVGTGQLAFPCSYQYVTKLNGALTQIGYSTFVTGSWGASPAAISVDAQGEVLLAGTTFSPDYPTTARGLQPIYVANAPPPPQSCLFGCIFPPPASGYLTKLNATGSALLNSTFFSGTQADTITFAAFTNSGIYLSGQARSADLPGFFGAAPAPCLPQTFAARLSPDGSEVARTLLVNGTVVAYNAATSGLIAWTGSDLVSVDPSAPADPIACILDAADLHPVSAIAPGQLLSIFGARLANVPAGVTGQNLPVTLAGVTASFNGIAGPLLYVSLQQVNVQAPFEIAGADQVSLSLRSTDARVAAEVSLPVVARDVSVFLDSTAPAAIGSGACPLNGFLYSGGPLPLAFNNDGTRNTCTNPAKTGSDVRVFLAGLGVTAPPQVTGSVNPDPGSTLNLPVVALPNGAPVTVTSAVAAPGSIAGVWQVDLHMPANFPGAVVVSLAVDSVPVRDASFTIWVR